MREMSRDVCLLLTGAGIGAAIMYILDPDRGNRRRALARDKLVAAGNKTSMYAGKLSRDLGNRAQGLVAETRARFRGEQVSDDVLVDRVKAELGRHAVHHRALDITANGGRVTLQGPALASEVDELLSAVASVRGVQGVDNQLEVHERADGISSLQGEVAAAASA
ncbi:MAG TPA: BON domain-containing protein [Pyrinomonadaceae bacterium]